MLDGGDPTTLCRLTSIVWVTRSLIYKCVGIARFAFGVVIRQRCFFYKYKAYTYILGTIKEPCRAFFFCVFSLIIRIKCSIKCFFSAEALSLIHI